MATVSSTIDGNPFFLEKSSGAVDPIYYSASDMRDMLAAIIGKPGALGDGSAMRVTAAATVGMAIRVTAGAYMIGDYLTYLPATQTIDLFTFASSPSATRTHRVFLAVYDGQHAGNEYGAKIVVLEDTGGGAGTPVGAAAIGQLATISIAANQGNIQDKHITDTRVHGGVGAPFSSLTLYLNAGFASAGSDIGTAGFRLQVNNGVVRLSGAVKRANGSNFAAGTTYEIGRLSSNFYPNHTRYLVGAIGGSTQTWRLQIRTDGSLIAELGTSTPVLLFDGMSFELD